MPEGPASREVLSSFDAVITIGRTVLYAADIRIPVYVCDIHGADGWLVKGNYVEVQRRNYSGRMFASKDWGFIRGQLIDRSRWPTAEDLYWRLEQLS
jgi:hypothetical protein